MVQNSPMTSAHMSPNPSPPSPSNPSSPSYQQPVSSCSEFPPTSLFQHLQMLQLQQSQIVGPVGSVPMATSGIPSGVILPPVCVSPPYALIQMDTGQPPTVAVQPTTQRTSPPLSGYGQQNLHMIKEDSIDSPGERMAGGSTVTEDDADLDETPVVLRSGEQSRKASGTSDDGRGERGITDFEHFRRKFAKNTPRISITDAHGHVMLPNIGVAEDIDVMITGVDGVMTGLNQPVMTAAAMAYHQFGCAGVFSPPSCYPIDYCAGMDLSTVRGLSDAANCTHTFDASAFPPGYFTGGGNFAYALPTSNELAYQQAAGGSGAVDNAVYAHHASDPPLSLANTLHNELNDVQQMCALTRRTMSDLFREMTRALEAPNSGIVYQRQADNRFVLQHRHAAVSLEIELCHGEPDRALKFRRLAGDSLQYNKICNDLLACLAL